MYENTCYKAPYLKEVIFRVDFPSSLDGFDKSLPKAVTKAISSRFPISEPRKAQTQEWNLAGSSARPKTTEYTQWVFFGKEREKSLVIEQTSLVFSIKTYKTYEEFFQDVEGVLKAVFEELADIAASRVGLRYVNVIDLDEPDPLSWADYINENILGIIDFQSEKEFLTRVFHIVEHNYDGLAVKHQFGLANPDYPAVIKRKQFVMDIDAYSHGSFDGGEVLNCIAAAHSKVQHTFERSITDKLREKMAPHNV